jgi:hypothetical protein
MHVRVVITTAALLCGTAVYAQSIRYRGAPDPLEVDEIVGADPRGHDRGVIIAPVLVPVIAAQNGDVPGGIEPLPVDIFTTTDFYADTELWHDPRYFRCNSPTALESLGGATRMPIMGDDPPRTAPWGYCDRDYPREEIVSPYPFDTAKAHYEALKSEARSRGGPTVYTQATLPAWNGRYERQRAKVQSWLYGNVLQIPTYLSLLTEEYQRYFVQQAYHSTRNQHQWPGTYCWPEGFMRRISQYGGGDTSIIMTPELILDVRFTSQRMVTQINIGREFNEDGIVPRLGPDVPQWYGETIGFWDGEALITWTSNIQGWISHGIHEYSSHLQTIEIYTPRRDEDDNLVGLEHEIVLYDDQAFVEPVRVVQWLDRVRDLNEGVPIPTDECIPSSFPINGQATPVSPGQTIEYVVPDIYGRPWGGIWERYFEDGMSRPPEDDIFDFGQ